MHHYTYRIEFSTGHYYIGARSSAIPPEVDKYTGSGKIVKDYIKAGRPFVKKIIGVHESREAMFLAEKEAVGDLFDVESYAKGRGLCLNLKPGGDWVGGGASHPFYGTARSDATKQRMREARLANPTSKKGQYTHTEEAKEAIRQATTGSRNAMFGRSGALSASYGVRATDERRRNQSEAKWNRNLERWANAGHYYEMFARGEKAPKGQNSLWCKFKGTSAFKDYGPWNPLEDAHWVGWVESLASKPQPPQGASTFQ